MSHSWAKPPASWRSPPKPLWSSELLNAHIGDKCLKGFVATLAELEVGEVFDRSHSLRVEFSEKELFYVLGWSNPPQDVV